MTRSRDRSGAVIMGMKGGPKLTEDEFLGQVIQLARLHGWRARHSRPGLTAKGYRTAEQGDGKGFPDLILVRDRIIFAELKVPPNKITEEQEDWLEALRVGADCYLWTPDDWDCIVEILARR